VVLVPPTPAPNLTPLAHGENFDWGSALHRGLSGNGGASTENGAGTPAPTPGPSARKYQVKPNETLWAIARNEYGNAAYVNHIIRANPGIDANRLRAGATIILPEKTEVVPDTGTARLAVAAPTTRPIDPTTQYRVQSGDNLFTIAKKVYGNINRAGKLYEANKDLIGPNPNALKLNMVLRLPEPPAPPATPAAAPAPAGTSPAISDLR
jgi:nucleoid-associated protein YgaU